MGFADFHPGISFLGFPSARPAWAGPGCSGWAGERSWRACSPTCAFCRVTGSSLSICLRKSAHAHSRRPSLKLRRSSTQEAERTPSQRRRGGSQLLAQPAGKRAGTRRVAEEAVVLLRLREGIRGGRRDGTVHRLLWQEAMLRLSRLNVSLPSLVVQVLRKSRQLTQSLLLSPFSSYRG